MKNQTINITYQKYKQMKSCFSYSFWKKVIIASVIVVLFGFCALLEDPEAIQDMIIFDIFVIACMSLCIKIIDGLCLKLQYYRMLKKCPYLFQYELFFLEDNMEIKNDTLTRKIYPLDIKKIKSRADGVYLLLHDKTMIPISITKELEDYMEKWLKNQNRKAIPKCSQYIDKTSNSYQNIRVFLIIVLVLTILSLFGGLFLLLVISTLANEPSALTLRYLWCFLLCLPVPMLSIVLGIMYLKKGVRCTKNIVVGFLIGSILLFIGISGLQNDFEIDYKKAIQYETILSESLPSKGKFFQIKWDESDLLDHISSYIKIQDSIEAKIFLNNIKHNQNWIIYSQIDNSVKQFLPTTLYCESQTCYYSLYILELDAYNEIPMQTDKYHIYAMMYNPNNHFISIEEFSLWYHA